MPSEIFDSKRVLENSIQHTIPDLEATLIIDTDGTLLEYKSSEKFQNEHDMTWVKAIAEKISIRFKTKNFHKEFGGIHMTINLFDQHVLLVRPLSSEHIIVMILTASPSIKNSLDVMLGIKNTNSNQGNVS